MIVFSFRWLKEENIIFVRGFRMHTVIHLLIAIMVIK